MKYIYEVFDLKNNECVVYTNKIKNAAKKLGVCPHTLSRAILYRDGYFLWKQYRITRRNQYEGN